MSNIGTEEVSTSTKNDQPAATGLVGATAADAEKLDIPPVVDAHANLQDATAAQVKLDAAATDASAAAVSSAVAISSQDSIGDPLKQESLSLADYMMNNETDKRNRRLTEKAYLEKIRTFKYKQTAALSSVTKKRNEITRLMLSSGDNDTDNLCNVKTNFEEFNTLCVQYNDAVLAHVDLITDEDREQELGRLEMKQQSILDFKKTVSEWIHSVEQNVSDQIESASNFSKRSKSSRGSLKSVLAKEKANLAELLIEKSMIKKKQEIESAQLEISIAKAKARNEVFEDLEQEDNRYKGSQITERSNVKLNPNAHVYTPVSVGSSQQPTVQSSPAVHNDFDQNNSVLLQAHQQISSAMQLPTPEVPKFKGNVLEFNTFIMSFEARIVPHAASDADKLYYLDQHLEGEAKDLISGCLYMNSDGYQSARELLQREFGNPYKVSSAYVQKALSWSVIKPEDGKGLKAFSYFLIKCRSAMNSMNHMTVLNHIPNLQAIVQKLPIYLQNKWRDKVIKLRQQTERFVSFSDLVEFVSFAAESANDPIFSRQAMKPSQTSSKRKSYQRENASNFSTDVVSKDRPKFVRKCQCCGKSHDLDDCEVFNQKSFAEKREFIRSKNMCYGCYGYNHIAKGCIKRRTCKHCGKRHPSALHEDNYNSQHNGLEVQQNVTENQMKETVSTSAIGKLNDIILQAILPVKVKQEGSDKVVETYAFYDNGSTGCFLSTDLKQSLEAKGVKTQLNLKTMHGQCNVETESVANIIVADCNDDFPLKIAKSYTRDEIPVNHEQIPRPEFLHNWPHLKEVSNKIPPYKPDLKIGLLIGSNCPKALQPLKVIATDGDGPFAVLFRHGWTIHGPVKVTVNPKTQKISCNRVMFKEVLRVTESILPKQVLQMLETDFSEKDVGSQPGETGYSVEDRVFMQTMKDNTRFIDGHYELPLPFKNNFSLKNNKSQAVKRASSLLRKMQKDEAYHKEYKLFMDKLLSKGFAYKVPADEIKKNARYLPHHGVYHPKKGKLRVVFDCSAKFEDRSINDELLQGPNLTNSLTGVLTRFRQDKVALIGDIEAMFYQVNVPYHQHDFLRFLWWPEGDLAANLEEYRMSVHIFGATSSPSVSNFALKCTADNAEENYGKKIADTIRRNFYVDDCLKSVSDEHTAIALLKDVTDACAEGGFKLTKFTSNCANVLKSVSTEECSKVIQSVDLSNGDILTEHALGIKWNVNNDTFGFNVEVKSKPVTRRGLLSVVSSVYDPLGFIAPFILPAKKLMQDMCQLNFGWDDELQSEQLNIWSNWLAELIVIEKIEVPRCVQPDDFADVLNRQVHVFADASSIGYGAVAYLRIQDVEGKIHVSFLQGKSRLAPLKSTTIPRLELTAATVAVKLGCHLMSELELEVQSITYHTDSTTVLHYIRNEEKRFPVFVANRVRMIRDFSEPEQWKHIEGKINPADLASRGLNGTQMVENVLWRNGPDFLWENESKWPQTTPQDIEALESQESHCIESRAITVDSDNNPTATLISYYSDWHKLKKAVAVYRRVWKILYYKNKMKSNSPVYSDAFNVKELTDSEMAIIRFVQRRSFKEEIVSLENQTQDQEIKRGRARTRRQLQRTSSIFKLDPYYDHSQKILKVGGRLQYSGLVEETKHPILLPQKDHVTGLIVKHVHERLAHAGRNHVLSVLREKYWVIHANSVVRSKIHQCVTCRCLRAPAVEQMMSDLPSDRVNVSQPFECTGVDYFGPFVVKEGRKSMKRYGVLFTCLASRAVHIETANSLDTSSFINALRRFNARRGAIREIRSDNGTNFRGAEKELRAALQEMNQNEIQEYLLKGGIDWKFNVPSASHMGGVWERQIRTVRKVLSGLVRDIELDDESFRTLMCEVESIINSRPITPVSMSPDDLEPLCPNHILTSKSILNFSPPGCFQKADVYMRKRWRRIQYLANVFWSRWKREYLNTLQERQKWNRQRRNMEVGDVALVKDENLPRSMWTMGRVTDVMPDKKGNVRNVMIKCKTSNFMRPVQKLVLILPVEEQ